MRDSDLETVFENLLRQGGLPVPTSQHRLRAPNGRKMRVDYVYDQYTVGVELFGAEFHATPEQWADDMARLTTLSALGWHILTFTYDDVHSRPEMVLTAVRNALMRAGFDSRRQVDAAI